MKFSFSRWLLSRWLLKGIGTLNVSHWNVRRKRLPRAPALNRLRLGIESLEDRTVPSIALWTDLADYEPGETAILTASGFDLGETVTFQVTADVAGPGQDPWDVTDGSADDLDGEINGTIVTSWLVDPGGAYLGVTLTATVTGISGSASTTFTDSGQGSPANITAANGWSSVNGSNPTTTINAPSGFIIIAIAIKSGESTFPLVDLNNNNIFGDHGDENHKHQSDDLGTSQHSHVITSNGTYGTGGNQYQVSGIGTATVTVTRVSGKNISHVDYLLEKKGGQTGDPTFSISGRKFEDLDGDGTDDGGSDPGLGGWTIYLDNDADFSNGTIASVTTASNGSYQFISTGTSGPGVAVVASLSAGTWYVYEGPGPSSGWTQTKGGSTAISGDPNGAGVNGGNGGYAVVLSTTNPTSSSNDFGNFKNVVISGTKFEDHDGDGVQDPGDQGLAGWTILVNGQDVGVVTDSHGNWSYTAGPGTFTFQEVLQSGWTQTYGNAGYTITTSSGSDVTGLDFGNFKNITISGLKFYDANGDGVKNDPAVIAGWTIYLDNDADFTNGVLASTTTDGLGAFSFSNLGPGTYYVYEGAAPSSGWFQTLGGGITINGNPGPTIAQNARGGAYFITASSGVDVAGNDFGNLKECAGTGGRTLGFWTNKNGELVIMDNGGASSELALLSSLDLVQNSLTGKKITGGTDFDPTSYLQLKNWLLAANATNMAYMLSAQLAAAALAVEAGYLGLNTYINVSNTGLMAFQSTLNAAINGQSLTGFGYTNSGSGLSNLGYISIADLMLAANEALKADKHTLDGDANRAYQEVLKNVLDMLNNNKLSFICEFVNGTNPFPPPA
jgi:hypothetical protein